MGKMIYFAGGLLFGGLTGFASVNYFLKEKYRKKCDNDVSSVKETYRGVVSELEGKIARLEGREDSVDSGKMQGEKRVEPIVLSTTRVHADRARDKGDISKYMNHVRMYGADEKEPVQTHPYVIPPEEFGEKKGYEQISLTWYADETLADMDDHRLSDGEIEKMVGHDAMTHFGEYENDSVFVRNEELKCDYEILMDHRKYTNVLEDRPYLNE